MEIKINDYDKEEIKELVKDSDNEIIKNLFKWKSYIEFCYKDRNELITFKEDSKLLGFLFITKAPKGVKLYAIATNKNHQKKGLGSYMFNYLIEKSKNEKQNKIYFDSDDRYSGFVFFTKKLNLTPIKKKNEHEYTFEIKLNEEKKWW